ncbi:MAG: tetratricopeptide repeat protein [Pirellulaceae bacterium]|nr:tetratricopeptide repeat protein [Pirellulaceae bacterium]
MNRPKLLKYRACRIALMGLSTLSLASGCASLSGPGSWFSGSTGNGGLASTLSNTGQGVTGQVKSMGTTMSTAMVKAKNIVTSPFAPSTDKGDPTSLSNLPDSLGPEIWVTNGQLYESQSKYAKAQENYTKALTVEPTNQAALLSMARLHVRQQQYAEAEQMFVKALAGNPQADVYNELASILQKQGRMAEAQSAVQQAIAAEPSSQRFRNNLAGMLVASGRSDEAVQQLSQVFPPAIASYNVAYLHFANQDLAGAQQYLQTALQADPNLKEARDLMDKINGSPTAQNAVAAYQTANQIYRTAQATVTPTPPANNAVYQIPQSPPTQMPSYPQ